MVVFRLGNEEARPVPAEDGATAEDRHSHSMCPQVTGHISS
jgi:hypothetical protein